jgi:hypothetical protein
MEGPKAKQFAFWQPEGNLLRIKVTNQWAIGIGLTIDSGYEKRATRLVAPNRDRTASV